MPLNQLAEACQCGNPERLLGTAELTFELVTPHGRLRLAAQNPWAYCDGLAIWMGFVPTATEQGLAIHRLPAEKCLGPLLAPVPLPTRTGRVVVVDPGHGGANRGTRSVLDDEPEKTFTLDWAMHLAPLLQQAGWRVVLTRTNDVDLSLAERVAVADRANADLFLSLHFNSVEGRRDLEGIETFCLTPKGLPSTITRNYEDDPAREFPNNAFDEENLAYAYRLHRAMVLATEAADRGVRRARFMGVLQTQQRPAVLIEGGYLSNPDEALLIASPQYRQKLAEALAGALTESFSLARGDSL